MSGFVNVSILFHAVVSIKDRKQLHDLIFKDTEWIGEPKGPLGCIVSMSPKDFQVIKGASSMEMPESDSEETPVENIKPEPELKPETTSDLLPILKGYKIGDSRIEKRRKNMIEALAMKTGIILVLSTKSGIHFERIEDMIGKEVVVNHENRNTGTIIVVGEG